ncbi:hypothetical protein L9F63_010300, partial [Diploptera punctata]
IRRDYNTLNIAYMAVSYFIVGSVAVTYLNLSILINKQSKRDKHWSLNFTEFRKGVQCRPFLLLLKMEHIPEIIIEGLHIIIQTECL